MYTLYKNTSLNAPLPLFIRMETQLSDNTLANDNGAGAVTK